MSRHDGLAARVYGFLAEDEDARVCREIPDDACDAQPRSFLLQLGALVLTRLGDTLISPRLVLAWMLSALAVPAVFIGFLVPLRESLALLPQLVVAQYLRERPVRKWFWVGGALGQAAALVAMAAGVMRFEGSALGLWVIAALATFSLARGVCSVTAKDVIGKTVSRTRRGRLTGQAASFAGAGALLLAVVVMFAPLTDGSRLLYVWLLGGSALLWVGAAVFYAGIPEVPGATGGGGNAISEAVRSVGLLKRDRDFAAFVLARALLVATSFAIPYLVVLIQRAGERGVTTLGAMLFASGLAGLLAGAAWGRYADRDARGTMRTAALLTVTVIGGALALKTWFPSWLASAPVAAGLLFAASVAHHGARVGRKTYLVDMADATSRARYVAVSNTAMGVVLLGGALLGWLDHALGATAVLGLLGMLGLLAARQASRLRQVSG